ncbi:CYIR protein [Plasmodium cynomolgi strain B]|uniref:CYIR protein n=1 Tax=Plasmodium cynomolgi (strain B) TaxID=1120755 RepID=K6VJN8_PLACD|nr:CYIR protein [Plasmodium cynomolgi strain B]GAB69627.1 CYIR protein [Plasmodium cynomolgi strain B]
MITHNAHTGGTVTVIFDNNSKTLDKVECLSIYAEIVEHVQVKIAEFKEKGHANFKDECEKLITYIKQEKEKHKECYTKWSLDLNLDNYEDINEYRAAETSISGKPRDRRSPLIVTDSANDCMISLSSVGTADVGVISASSDHTPSSVKSTIENDPPREGYVTKTADNAHNDSKGACDAVSDVEAKEDKAPCSDNPGKSGPCLVVDGGTSCSEVSSETSYIEESTCKTHIREINIDKNISSTYHDANNSLCARDLTSSDKNSLLHPNGQEIRGIQDSFASVCNSMVLQRDSSPQSDPHTRQETTGLVSQVQTEKTQNYEKSLQEPNSNMEHDTNIQNSPNQKDLQVSTQGSPHGNQETSGGKHYLKDKHSQPTACIKKYRSHIQPLSYEGHIYKE